MYLATASAESAWRVGSRSVNISHARLTSPSAAKAIAAAAVEAFGTVDILVNNAGNLRDKSFFELWDSKEAVTLREQIASKQCYCTTEVFMWPSIVFQPVQLTRAFVGAKRRWGANE